MLQVPPVPLVYQSVWRVWLQLSGQRTQSDGGFGPLILVDVLAYLEMTETALRPWEVEALLLIDGCWRASFHDRRTYPFEDDPEED